MHAAAALSSDGPITLARLLSAGTIAAYCDGTTVRDRGTDSSFGSAVGLAELCVQIARHIDPAADTRALDGMIAHADAASAERAAASNAAAPPFSAFLAAANAAWSAVMRADATLESVSIGTFTLLQVAVAPTRERMLLYTRAADEAAFDVAAAHSVDALAALKAAHPAHMTVMTLATVLFRDGEPVCLVMGVWPDNKKRSKNEWFEDVDLCAPLLPETALLLPYAHTGLKQLWREYAEGVYLFRRRDAPTAAPLGKNFFQTHWNVITLVLQPHQHCPVRPGSARRATRHSPRHRSISA